MDEQEFLQHQAEHAKAAIAQAWDEMKARLGQGADPRLWAKEYPWITVGTAAVAGFLATALLVPSKEQQALNKLAAIERALNPQQPKRSEPAPATPANGDSAQEYKPGRSSFLTLLTREVIGAVKPAIISLLTAGVTASQAKPSEAEMQAAASRENQQEANQAAE